MVEANHGRQRHSRASPACSRSRAQVDRAAEKRSQHVAAEIFRENHRGHRPQWRFFERAPRQLQWQSVQLHHHSRRHSQTLSRRQDSHGEGGSGHGNERGYRSFGAPSHRRSEFPARLERGIFCQHQFFRRSGFETRGCQGGFRMEQCFARTRRSCGELLHSLDW